MLSQKIDIHIAQQLFGFHVAQIANYLLIHLQNAPVIGEIRLAAPDDGPFVGIGKQNAVDKTLVVCQRLLELMPRPIRPARRAKVERPVFRPRPQPRVVAQCLPGALLTVILNELAFKSVQARQRLARRVAVKLLFEASVHHPIERTHTHQKCDEERKPDFEKESVQER